MSAGNGHGAPGADAGAGAVAAARPVVLVRCRPGVVGETARVGHVVPLPIDVHAGGVGAVCGAVLLLEDIETLTPGVGMPCIVCVVTQAVHTERCGESLAGGLDGADAGELTGGGACYQEWG